MILGMTKTYHDSSKNHLFNRTLNCKCKEESIITVFESKEDMMTLKHKEEVNWQTI